MARKMFQPHTMEITRQLDVSGLDDRQAEKLRKELFPEVAEDPIVKRAVVGLAEALWLQILWRKWRQWLRWVAATTETGEGTSGAPTKTEEVTTRYQVESEE
jgi:hypothetical protein